MIFIRSFNSFVLGFFPTCRGRRASSPTNGRRTGHGQPSAGFWLQASSSLRARRRDEEEPAGEASRGRKCCCRCRSNEFGLVGVGAWGQRIYYAPSTSGSLGYPSLRCLFVGFPNLCVFLGEESERDWGSGGWWKKGGGRAGAVEDSVVVVVVESWRPPMSGRW